jgi:ADP-heptose:LPS heptosyltransferase
MRGDQRIIISRTDSIGDVVLTLPVAGMLKKQLPGCRLIFLGKSYTRDVIRACKHIDEFLDWDEISGNPDPVSSIGSVNADMIIHIFPRREIARIAKKAGIPVRMGTTNRLYHWGNCNKLVRLSRKRSGLHEAQLNLKLIKTISGIRSVPLESIYKLYGLSGLDSQDEEFEKLIAPGKFNLILHPKSKGSAREWGLDNYKKLIDILPEEKFSIYVSGTAAEAEIMKESGILEDPRVTNLCGKMTLAQLMSFIKRCDGLVAASTGPLHLAAALGTKAIGIYPPIKPMHPGRWAPLGEKASYLVQEKECNDCRKEGRCHCMEEITPDTVKIILEESVSEY